MNKLSALLTAAALGAATALPALAQEDVLRPVIPAPISFGVEIGGNYNMFSQTITKTIEIPDSPLDAIESGTAITPYGFVWVDYEVEKNIGVQFKLGLDRKAFGNDRDGQYDLEFVENGSPEFDIVDINYAYEVAATFLTFGAMGRFDVTDWLRITAGPVYHVRLDSSRQSETFTLQTAGYEWRDPVTDAPLGQVAVFERGIQSDPSSRLGLEFAAGVRIPVSSSIDLIPTARFQFMLTEFAEDAPSQDQFRKNSIGTADMTLTDRQLHSAQLGIALNFR